MGASVPSLIIPLDCPHCRTKKIGFQGVFEYRHRTDLNTQKMIVGICPSCRHAVSFLVELSRHSADGKLIVLTGGLSENGIRILDFWPKLTTEKVPESVPGNVQSVVQQAYACLENGLFDAAGVMFRKALEIITKEQAPDLRNATLDKRIEKLSENGAIPKEVKDWAHEIRLEGNFAAHGIEPFTQEQAHTLKRFCEAFLMYIYTMPALVAESRSRRSEPLPSQIDSSDEEP